MGTGLGGMILEEAAKEAAGNWMKFECFGWHRAYELGDADKWTIIYTHQRDGGLLDMSNAGASRKAMEPFLAADESDVMGEHHGRLAVGWVDGFAIRVFRGGQITEPFKAYRGLAERLADYPVLDEEGYSEREYEATLANVADASRPLRDGYELPDAWESAVFAWFWNDLQRAFESRDDRGGYPSEDNLRAAFDGLGYERLDGRIARLFGSEHAHETPTTNPWQGTCRAPGRSSRTSEHFFYRGISMRTDAVKTEVGIKPMFCLVKLDETDIDLDIDNEEDAFEYLRLRSV